MFELYHFHSFLGGSNITLKPACIVNLEYRFDKGLGLAWVEYMLWSI